MHFDNLGLSARKAGHCPAVPWLSLIYNECRVKTGLPCIVETIWRNYMNRMRFFVTNPAPATKRYKHLEIKR